MPTTPLPGRERLKANYTNAAREGRTKPGLVETIDADDPRHWTNAPRHRTNRADRRAAGQYGQRRFAYRVVSGGRGPTYPPSRLAG